MERTLKIDLHIHSNCSDGAFSPKEIIDIAKSNRTSIIAIADHDTTLAYTPELFDYAKQNNIQLIPAVEMSTKFFGVGIHVLGYNFDLNNQALINCLSMLKNARLNYLMEVSKALESLGYVLNTNQLKELPTVTKAHIAKDIVENEANNSLLLKTFNHIPSMGEFIETIMNEGCPAHVEKFSISPIEASKIIHQAGGKVVLAHPVAYMHEDNFPVEKIKTLLDEMNADGIEANYIYVNVTNNIINESKFWNNFAKENNLIATIGSDFHNFDGVRPEIGFSNMNFALTESEIQSILKFLTNY